MPRSVSTLLALAAAALLTTVAVAAPLLSAGPPANDSFARAQAVAVSGLIRGNAARATAQPGEPGVRRGARTLWYAWTPVQSGVAYVVPTHPHERPVRVNAYRGRRLAHLTPVGRPATGSPAPLVAVDAFAGQTVKLQVVGGGPFALQIVQPFAGSLPNASPTTAESLASVIAGLGAHRTAQTTIAGTTAGGSGAGAAVYYAYDAPPSARGRIRVGLTGLDPNRVSLHVRLDGRPVGSQGVLTLVPGRRHQIEVAGPPAYFTLAFARLPGLSIDTSVPVVSCTVPRGWLNSNRGVRCHARDDGSGLADPRQRTFSLHTSVPRGALNGAAGTSATQVCDRAGNCASAGPYTGLRVDLTRPAVTCEPASSRTAQISVSVNCRASASPGGAPLAHPALGSFVLTATLAPGQANPHTPFPSHAPICNTAGTCTSVPPPATVAIDRIGPQISCSPAPQGWHTAVTITCQAQDRRSRLADPADSRFELKTSLPVGSVTRRAFTPPRSVCDVAGNCTIAPSVGPLAIDRQPPVVACAVPTGWVRARGAGVVCQVRDAGAGLLGRTPPQLRLGTGIRQGVEGPVSLPGPRVCDRLGNCVTVGPFTIRVDARPPQVRCAVPPAAWQRGPVSIGCTAADLGSGLAPRAAGAVLSAAIPLGQTGVVSFPQRRFCDRAGNCALTPARLRVRIDRQAPTIRCRALSRRSQRENVRVLCLASDGRGSGLADARDHRFILNTSVPAGLLAPAAPTPFRGVCDVAGNCTTVGPLHFRVDRRPARAGR